MLSKKKKVEVEQLESAAKNSHTNEYTSITLFTYPNEPRKMNSQNNQEFQYPLTEINNNNISSIISQVGYRELK